MSRTIQAIMLLSMLVVLTACVTNDNAPSAMPVARGQASVTIGRPNGWYGAAVAVDIEANGTRIASLAAGGTYTGPVPPGPVTLTATCWSSPGRYTIHFNAEAGKRYDFEVSSRNEQIAASVAFGVVGLVADTAINESTSGAFKITAVAK
jgi:hypothetical protein